MEENVGYTLTLVDNFDKTTIVIPTGQGGDEVVEALARAMVAVTFSPAVVRNAMKAYLEENK